MKPSNVLSMFFSLVACYATLHPALSVRRSVRRSVRPPHFTFFGFLRFLALLLLPKWSGLLNYSPCPPARDWGSRISGLVIVWSKNVLSLDRSDRARDWSRNSCFLSFFHYQIHLRLGLIELTIDLGINYARRIVLAHVSGLVSP